MQGKFPFYFHIILRALFTFQLIQINFPFFKLTVSLLTFYLSSYIMSTKLYDPKHELCSFLLIFSIYVFVTILLGKWIIVFFCDFFKLFCLQNCIVPPRIWGLGRIVRCFPLFVTMCPSKLFLIHRVILIQTKELFFSL